MPAGDQKRSSVPYCLYRLEDGRCILAVVRVVTDDTPTAPAKSPTAQFVVWLTNAYLLLAQLHFHFLTSPYPYCPRTA